MLRPLQAEDNNTDNDNTENTRNTLKAIEKDDDLKVFKRWGYLYVRDWVEYQKTFEKNFDATSEPIGSRVHSVSLFRVVG